jgi:hypothetical protein
MPIFSIVVFSAIAAGEKGEQVYLTFLAGEGINEPKLHAGVSKRWPAGVLMLLKRQLWLLLIFFIVVFFVVLLFVLPYLCIVSHLVHCCQRVVQACAL